MTAADDQRLLHATALGDRRAFEAFVEHHRASVFRLLRSMGSTEADAEDALQETFLAAWRSAGSYRGSVSARGWILTIARNALRRAHRRRVGEPAGLESLDELGLEAGWGSTDDDLLDKIARKELLSRALEELGPDDREILVLRELEGMEGREVAEILELSVPAMKSRLHRARLRLVAALREVHDEQA